MTLAIYTFANQAYVPALAGLINSIRHLGFKGVIHVGSPEPLSIAAEALEAVEIHVLGMSAYWAGNRKAELLLAYPSECFIFLDADIIVTDATFLERMKEWLSISPVFALEGIVASVDYRRHMWAKRLGRASQSRQWCSYYYNSGVFGGIMKRDRGLLEAWDSAIRNVLAPPARLFSDVDFPYPDQDVLNALLQDWEPPPIGIGPPDIWVAASPHNPFLYVGGFKHPAVVHCTGYEKPWTLLEIPDRRPNPYELAWYEQVVVKGAPVRIKVQLSSTMRFWFEQRRLLRLALGLRRIARRI